MKKRKIIFVFCVFIISIFGNAQEKCVSPEENIEDLNSITKCSVKKLDNTTDKNIKQISVKVSVSRRSLIKRKRLKKSARAVRGINTVGVQNTNAKEVISTPIFLNTKVTNLTSKLSSEQARSAAAFEDVDKIPAFNSCKSENNSKNLDCFNEQMMLHIQKHFRYPNDAVISKTQGEVWIRFIIDENGTVTNIKTLGPENGEILIDEAIRVVSNLPKFTPAMKKGKKVLSKFGFPINFSLEE
ncbi:energy transducer TonB [Tenacibaculum salmonis]|uniref:energy transducer TonB n=1 Tax=Tenacibaculum sp. P3-BQ1 TaxID=3232310 RepID=UPI0034DF62B6